MRDFKAAEREMEIRMEANGEMHSAWAVAECSCIQSTDEVVQADTVR